MDYKALATWALGRSTGASATCIARRMLGLDTDGSYPSDGGDFGRCEMLMEMVPGIRERLPDMATVNRYWAALVPQWEDIRGCETDDEKRKAIQSIVRRMEDDDPHHVRLGHGASMRFGNPT